MNEEELEDAIWKVTEYPITKTNVWRAVGGDKQTCLNKINQMVATSRLKEEETGKNRAVTVTRINTENKAEFERMLDFQVHSLGECRKAWSKLKSGMFEPPQYVVHCEPPLPHIRTFPPLRMHSTIFSPISVKTLNSSLLSTSSFSFIDSSIEDFMFENLGVDIILIPKKA